MASAGEIIENTSNIGLTSGDTSGRIGGEESAPIDVAIWPPGDYKEVRMVCKKRHHKKESDVSNAAATAAKLAAQLAEQAQVLAHQGAEWATPYAEQAAEKLAPVISDAKDKAVQFAGQAQELAHQGVEWATPRAQDAADAIKPVVDDAARKAADAKDKLVNEYYPRAKRMAAAAAAAARETEGDVKTKAVAIQESALKAFEDPKPKKHRAGKIARIALILSGVGAAVYFLWKRSQPTEDPWAEAYWKDAAESAPTAETPAVAGPDVTDLKEKAEDIKDAVADKAEDLKDAAEDKAEDLKDGAEDLKEKAEEAKDATEDALEDAAAGIEEATKEAAEKAKRAAEHLKED